jgi:hypothetical protein
MDTNENKLDEQDSLDRVSAERLNYQLSRQNAAQNYNAEMSKWILASLVFINSSPFLLISKDAPNYSKYLLQSASYFIVGMTLAVLCGFLAWLNTGMRELLGSFEVRRLLVEPNSPERHDMSRGESITASVVRFSYVCSILVGFGSLLMFLIGALTLSTSSYNP